MSFKREFRDMTGEQDDKGRVIYDIEWKARSGESMEKHFQNVVDYRESTQDKDVVFKWNAVEVVAEKGDDVVALKQKFEKEDAKMREEAKKQDLIEQKQNQAKLTIMENKLPALEGDKEVLEWLASYSIAIDKKGMEFNGKKIAKILEEKGYSAKDADKPLEGVIKNEQDKSKLARNYIGHAMKSLAKGETSHPGKMTQGATFYNSPKALEMFENSQLPKMEVKDEKAWNTLKNTKTSDYDRATIEYAEKWAAMMQKGLSEGKDFSSVAEETKSKADTKGLSGHQANTAVSVLSEHWLHGDKLKKWQIEKDKKVQKEADDWAKTPEGKAFAAMIEKMTSKKR